MFIKSLKYKFIFNNYIINFTYYFMIYVTFGSQTGNSEEIAKRIYKEIKEKFKLLDEAIELLVMNKFLTKIQKIPENKSDHNIIIAVCSTTGAGDAPTNSDNFVRWIKRKTLAADTLSNVNYTVLGLGDSNYTKYQFIPKQIDDCLVKLGATRFYQRGEADDAYGLEIVVEPWIEGLFPILEKLLIKLKSQIFESENKAAKAEEQKDHEKKINIDISLDNSKFRLIGERNKSEILEKNSSENINKIAKENIKNLDLINAVEFVYENATVTDTTVISGPKSDKRIFSVKFEISSQERDLYYANYSPGATVALLPPENDERLSVIYSVLEFQEDYLQIDKSNHFNVYSEFLERFPHFKKFLAKGYLTRNEIFRYVIDFNSVLKKLPSETLRHLLKAKIKNIEVFEKIDLIFSKYTDSILKNKISLFDIITCISKYKLTLPVSLLEILENFPVKYPRQYSLVSFQDERRKQENLEIIFSVVDERIIRKFPHIKFNNLPAGITPGEFYYKGQSTNYLKDLSKGDSLFICSLKNVGFNFPLNTFLNEKIPIIYICNGTGISPCISFIKQLLNKAEEGEEKSGLSSLNTGELLILTGFRNASPERNETIYEDFIQSATETLKLSAGRDIITYKRCVSSSEENEEEEVGIWRNCRINTKYVQDLIIECEDKIYHQLFVQRGYLMICGDVQKLYDECIENIITVLKKKASYSREQSVKLIEDMKICNKIIVEKWI